MELEAGTNDHQFGLNAKRPVVMARRLPIDFPGCVLCRSRKLAREPNAQLSAILREAVLAYLAPWRRGRAYRRWW